MMSRLRRERVHFSDLRFQVLLACFTFLWALCAAQTVGASGPAIVWRAPSDCPTEADMVSRVRRSLGADTSQTQLSAVADVTQISGVYRAAVRIQGRSGSGERVLENANCEILADSVALVIALSASGSSALEERGLTLALSAHATAVSGPLPKFGLGLGVGLAFEGVWALRVELSGSYYVEQSSTYDQTSIGARFQMLRFGARGCRLWSVGRFDFAPCFGAEIYRVAGEGYGGMKYSNGTAYVWGPALGVFGRLRLFSVVGLVVAADATVPVTRRRFIYSDLGPLHRPAALAFQLFIAPEVQF